MILNTSGGPVTSAKWSGSWRVGVSRNHVNAYANLHECVTTIKAAMSARSTALTARHLFRLFVRRLRALVRLLLAKPRGSAGQFDSERRGGPRRELRRRSTRRLVVLAMLHAPGPPRPIIVVQENRERVLRLPYCGHPRAKFPSVRPRSATTSEKWDNRTMFTDAGERRDRVRWRTVSSAIRRVSAKRQKSPIWTDAVPESFRRLHLRGPRR